MNDDIERTSREQVGNWLGRVYRRRFQLSEMFLEKIGVGPGQVPILSQLHYHGELTQRELAEHTHVTAATISGTLKRMEKAGLVRREMDEHDQRILRVHLSEQGRQMWLKSTEQIRAVTGELMEGFSAEERQQMHEYLCRIAKNMERAVEKHCMEQPDKRIDG